MSQQRSARWIVSSTQESHSGRLKRGFWFRVPLPSARGPVAHASLAPESVTMLTVCFPSSVGTQKPPAKRGKATSCLRSPFVSKQAILETPHVAGNRNPSSGRDASVPCPGYRPTRRPPFADTPGLPQARELPIFQHIGPAQDRVCLEVSGPGAHGPGIPSSPPPCRGKIVLDPSPPLLQGPLLAHTPRAVRAAQGRTAGPDLRALFLTMPTPSSLVPTRTRPWPTGQ